ncbi:MAG TPA: hypothetical protein DEQ30_03395 [Porphyromonadaceae bacterium]|nr:hypothetical protein [Porphyromonadaceae bacterium]
MFCNFKHISHENKNILYNTQHDLFCNITHKKMKKRRFISFFIAMFYFSPGTVFNNLKIEI